MADELVDTDVAARVPGNAEGEGQGLFAFHAGTDDDQRPFPLPASALNVVSDLLGVDIGCQRVVLLRLQAEQAWALVPLRLPELSMPPLVHARAHELAAIVPYPAPGVRGAIGDLRHAHPLTKAQINGQRRHGDQGGRSRPPATGDGLGHKAAPPRPS